MLPSSTRIDTLPSTVTPVANLYQFIYALLPWRHLWRAFRPYSTVTCAFDAPGEVRLAVCLRSPVWSRRTLPLHRRAHCSTGQPKGGLVLEPSQGATPTLLLRWTLGHKVGTRILNRMMIRGELLLDLFDLELSHLEMDSGVMGDNRMSYHRSTSLLRFTKSLAAWQHMCLEIYLLCSI